MEKTKFIEFVKNGDVALMEFDTTKVLHSLEFGAEKVIESYQYEKDSGTPSTIMLVPFKFSPTDQIYEIRLDFNQFEKIQLAGVLPFAQKAILIRVPIPHHESDYYWNNYPAYTIFDINQYGIQSIWIIDTDIDIVVRIYAGDCCVVFESARTK
jgi:hypothetical protein